MKNKLSKVEQLKAAILDDIRTGIYQAGDELLSIRELCPRYRMSKQTVSQALAELNQRGILNVSHGRSTRVTGHPEARRIELICISRTGIEVQEFWRDFYCGIKNELSAIHGYEIGVIQFGTGSGRLLHERLMSHQVCGVITLGSIYYETVWQQLYERHLPVVRLYDCVGEKPIETSLITTDFHASLTDIIRLFLTRGCRKIAYCGACIDKQREVYDNDKFECFKQVLKENGLTFDPQFFMNSPDMEMEDSYNQLLPLLRSFNRPDAVFIASDVLAPGIYRAAYEAGMKVPDDLMVAGCDNLAIGRLLVPSLTTIDQGREAMGRMAVRQLLSIINGEGIHNKQLIPAQLLPRKSLPPPNVGRRKHIENIL